MYNTRKQTGAGKKDSILSGAEFIKSGFKGVAGVHLCEKCTVYPGRFHQTFLDLTTIQQKRILHSQFQEGKGCPFCHQEIGNLTHAQV